MNQNSNKKKLTKTKKIKKKAVKNTANPKKDKQIKNVLKIFFISVIVIGISIAFIALSGVFNVEEIIVDGNSHISSEQIISFSRNNNR